MKTETKPKPKVPKIPAAHDSRAPALAVEAWPVDLPKPYAKNPRRNDAAVEKVAASIREFGWAQPIVVDGDGVIIIGHTRLKAFPFSTLPYDVPFESDILVDKKRCDFDRQVDPLFWG